MRARSRLYNGDITNFPEAIAALIEEADDNKVVGNTEPDDRAVNDAMNDAQKKATEAKAIYDRHVQAAEKAAAEEMLASDDPVVKAWGQALLDRDYTGFAI